MQFSSFLSRLHEPVSNAMLLFAFLWIIDYLVGDCWSLVPDLFWCYICGRMSCQRPPWVLTSNREVAHGRELNPDVPLMSTVKPMESQIGHSHLENAVVQRPWIMWGGCQVGAQQRCCQPFDQIASNCNGLLATAPQVFNICLICCGDDYGTHANKMGPAQDCL
jgi:hypothetical protein